jgi:plasmid stabilization system protein ParE
MTAGQGFDLHPLAAQDVAEIWTYIADDSPQAARRVREEILAAIRALRFIVVREYLIAYAPDEKPLWVVAVMHGRRNPRVMAAILRGREE